MYCGSLKFILIVIVFNSRHWSSCEASDGKTASSQINSILMLCIGAGILVAMLLLIGVVFSLYFKVSQALKAPKLPVCLDFKSNPFTVIRDKITAASSIAAEPYSGLPCCDECNVYNFDSLPPCFCEVNEGL
ncbi:family with sequence similarity 24 member B [Phyllostomus discolor]|uniref:Family with sequence similarity 24 member B n=1 Tax=Phyllostomus discolor TaxID=89673 RepID=A0A834AAE4_9CHIR|nr:family with sequence similarity 24 member B [Phyllostomus discolor]